MPGEDYRDVISVHGSFICGINSSYP